jgi:predicted DNA-binding transcriptional regulator YafY
MLFYFAERRNLMGTAERRLEILKYLCKYRRATMPQLAEMFGVSVRTIQRDILEIEATFHVPLDVRCGKYDGGVFVVGDYSFDRAYMHRDELELLTKVQGLVKNQLSDKENALLTQIINTYTKIA